MEIGIFQLENLVLTQSRFLFIYLAETKPQVAPEIDRLIARAQFMPEEKVVEYVKTCGADKTFPIILVAPETTRAKTKAVEIEAAGFNNVYWVGF